MDDLITRLQGLSAPDREVDCEIGVAVGWFVTEPNKGWPDRLDYIDVTVPGHRSYPGNGFAALVPPFTASIDSAMTLVPEGCLWTMDSWSSQGWSAGIWKPKDNTWLITSSLGRQTQSPALALASASLRARTGHIEAQGGEA